LWYDGIVHKTFYASGFLYHSPSQQILLQQLTEDGTSPLTLFRGKSRKGEDPRTVFQRSVSKILGITLRADFILPVYDYVHTTLGDHYIFYVDIPDSTESSRYKGKHVCWFPLAKLSKLNLTEQTRHDIIVGERVIRATEDHKQQSPQTKSH